MRAPFPLALALACGAGVSVDGRLHGEVRDASGRPVFGAWVAAANEHPGADDESTRPAAMVRSSCDGRFRLPPLPAGRYGLTASVVGRGAAFQAVALGGVAPAISVTLQLSAPSRLLSGSVRGSRGERVRHAQLRAHRWSDDSGAIFYAETGGDGSYALTVPSAGEYVLLVVAEGFRTRRVQLSNGAELLDIELERVGRAPPEVVRTSCAHRGHRSRPRLPGSGGFAGGNRGCAGRGARGGYPRNARVFPAQAPALRVSGERDGIQRPGGRGTDDGRLCPERLRSDWPGDTPGCPSGFRGQRGDVGRAALDARLQRRPASPAQGEGLRCGHAAARAGRCARTRLPPTCGLPGPPRLRRPRSA